MAKIYPGLMCYRTTLLMEFKLFPSTALRLPQSRTTYMSIHILIPFYQRQKATIRIPPFFPEKLFLSFLERFCALARELII